jgi:hypothetical protein
LYICTENFTVNSWIANYSLPILNAPYAKQNLVGWLCEWCPVAETEHLICLLDVCGKLYTPCSQSVGTEWDEGLREYTEKSACKSDQAFNQGYFLISHCLVSYHCPCVQMVIMKFFLLLILYCAKLQWNLFGEEWIVTLKWEQL